MPIADAEPAAAPSAAAGPGRTGRGQVTAPSPSRWRWLRTRDASCVALLLAVSAALWAPRLSGPLDLRFDAGVYYTLGTSLAEGRGYRLLNEPGEITSIQYPPALPALVALHQRVLGTTDPEGVGQALRHTFLVFFVLYVLAIYGLARRYVRPGFALAAGLLCALHLQTIYLSDLLFAEIPFALVSVLFFLCAGSRDARLRLLAPALGYLGFFLRSVGIALLAAWVGERLLKRDYRSAARRMLVALLPLLIWQGFTRSVQAGPEFAEPAYAYQRAPYLFYNVGYLDNILYRDPQDPDLGRATPAEVLVRLGNNALIMPRAWGEATAASVKWWEMEFARFTDRVPWLPMPTFLATTFMAAWGLLAAVGLILLARRRDWGIPLYVLGSTALICITPWPGQFGRYLVPLAPFLALGIVLTLQQLDLRSTAAGRPVRYAATAVIALLLTVILAEQARVVAFTYRQDLHTVYTSGDSRSRGTHRLFYYDERWRGHDAALAWLRANAEPHAVLGTLSPHWDYLHTGLKTVMPPFISEPAEAQRLMDDVPIRYLLVDDLNVAGLARPFGEAVIHAFPTRWERVYARADHTARIYRRVD